MAIDETYWDIVEPIWKAIDIYHGPDIFMKTFSAVRREAGLLYAAHFCQSEVCNGGFLQFFGNSTGVLAPEAVAGFRAIGQPQVAALIVEAMAPLGSPYERERQRRNEILDSLPDDAYDRIAGAGGDLNREFFDLIESEAGGFQAAANRYAESIVP